MLNLALRLLTLAAAMAVLVACGDDDTDGSTASEPTGTTEATEIDPTPTSAPRSGADGVWVELPDAPLGNRLNHSATWGGGSMMVWGGLDQESRRIAGDGAAWDPATGAWRHIPAAPIAPRWAHHAVWTGTELLVWGGSEGPDHLAECYADGARYDPTADAWVPIPPAPGPTRCAASVVWTGDELVVFGGHRGGGPPGPGSRHDDGVAYDPDTDRWRSIPSAPVAPRAASVAGWIDHELVIYGGHTQASGSEGFEYLTDGAAYDPDAGAWREIPESPLPPLRGIEAVALEDELMVLGGDDPELGADERSTAVVAYDPSEDRWRQMPDLPARRASWDGERADGVVYLIGSRLRPAEPGDEPEETPAAFLAYAVDEGRWLERADPPGGGRSDHALTWTGAELVVWGGQTSDAEPTPTGLRWVPSA